MTNPLQDPRFFQDPYPVYDELRSAGPVQKVPAGSGGHHSYVVTGYAEAREAFADPRLSKDTGRFFAGRPSGRNLHPAVSQSMLATDPPQHTRVRKAVGPAFTAGPVARLRPYITDVVDGLLSDWVPGMQVDLVARLAVPLPVTVICELLGVPDSDRSTVAQWSNDLFAAGRPDRIDSASHSLAGYMAQLVASKRSAPDGGLLHDLVVLDGEGRLTEAEVVSLAVLLLVAGHETTTNFIGNALLALMRHPDALARLREAPELIPTALDELLRLDSPVGIATFRHSTEALTLGGTDIPAGVPVLIAPGAANRDPARFACPDRLDLAREATSHLAFGHGIHRCLGAPLARAEGEIALRALLTRFPAIRLAVPGEDLRWRQTRLMRGLEALPVLL
ncbi:MULTISPECIES: cytochrome P450 family protein [Streptomyces]|uniref:cytochrome P450 family protein n=1 Tax=Streptomyces TaxID=1883 RepID=UPI0006B02DC9|nr:MULTISPECIES: cytochrome P450 [unclassified Streptomyces]KOU86623.1 cytochrome P450 [Streptomyces sp. XY58]KOV09721.1 cytochrome P450 [Streptomyces sp. XY37]KOV47402.1 cytochrome P450 [Streptomyces sp. MMG1064]